MGHDNFSDLAHSLLNTEKLSLVKIIMYETSKIIVSSKLRA
jgi:hypothetical protein